MRIARQQLQLEAGDALVQLGIPNRDSVVDDFDGRNLRRLWLSARDCYGCERQKNETGPDQKIPSSISLLDRFRPGDRIADPRRWGSQ